ncbi:MAG: beta-lactamase family protein [Leptospiraceae bacterium]|nr:beta-lactamase family protein [Leptospiraceae bacterium]
MFTIYGIRYSNNTKIPESTGNHRSETASPRCNRWTLPSLLLSLFILGLLFGCAGPLNRTEGVAALHNTWRDRLADTDHTANAQMYIYAPDLELDETFGPLQNKRHPFHVASVGKLFTTVLIAQLIESGRLDWDTRIAAVLPAADLQGLFVYSGKDYATEVSIEHLLTHTSGAADYFADRPASGVGISELILNEPERDWTPQDLLEFTRRYLHAHFAPGHGYHYSDTGYILLGLVVEQIAGRPYHQVLADRIFQPLQMTSAYMPYRSVPMNAADEQTMGETWFQGVQIDGYRSVTADWAGGGVVCTLEDLMRFDRALFGGELLNESTMQRLANFKHEFESGIYYGAGMMEYRFEDFFPLLTGYPRWRGHMGILATHAIYDPERNIYIVLNMGSDENIEAGFRLLIDVSGILMRIE